MGYMECPIYRKDTAVHKKQSDALSGSVLTKASKVGGAALLLLCLLMLLSGGALASDSRNHPFEMSSPNFRDGGALSEHNEMNQFGCHGDNVAPTLEWTGVPAGTKSFAFTINDVDAPVAGGFHHWVVFNIPGNVDELHNNPPYDQGTNSYPTVGYGGPCPPPDGQIHHYIFTVYALSVTHIAGDKTLTYEQLLSEIANDVQGITSIVGTFSRTSNS